jgi:hypothetical protein
MDMMKGWTKEECEMNTDSFNRRSKEKRKIAEKIE